MKIHICVHIAAKKLFYYPAFSQLIADNWVVLESSLNSLVAQSANAFLLMALKLHLCSWIAKLFLQKSKNSGGLGRPIHLCQLLKKLSRLFASSSIELQDQRNQGKRRATRSSLLYLGCFLSSCRLAAAPSISTDLGKVSELQG